MTKGGDRLSEMKKSCDTCAYSYYLTEGTREHCSNPNYNSNTYTHDMFMEDRVQGHCRFWTPKKERSTV